ncbi:hypothetical protein ROA7450_00986 [Roseovarius albus]|uniref:Leucine-binding protein domain-containing protein n=1 Tax=Roseovarius albus TaxID=1247867 RepID=A0A1X6YKS2_9RHOB|nr:penicillin-binding protein activator [Roseovarius albus]SLN24289.1 hypothetical protein ROA7450_00986 [Roseovarius albus]
MFAVFTTGRKMLRRIALLLPAFVLAACQTAGVGSNNGPSIDPNAPVAVALLVPHGSAVSNEAFLAKDLENAARLAVSDLSGVKIDLRVYGTAGQAGLAQQVALRAIDEGAKIIIGPLHASSANAVAVAVANKDVNVLAFSNNPTIAGGNLFVLGQTFENTADRLVDFSVSQGKSRIMTVYANNLAGQLGRDAIAQAIASNGATAAGAVQYEFSESGVVSAVPAIKQAVQSNQTNAIFTTANAAGALPLFSEMLPEAGLGPDAMQYIGLSRWDTPRQTLSLSGVQNGWFAMPDPSRTAQYRSRFEAAYGNTPHAISGLAYDGVAAVGALVKSGKRDALTTSALTQGAGFQGVTGVFRLLKDGTNERGLAVATVRNNQVVVVSPAPRSFSGAGF